MRYDEVRYAFNRLRGYCENEGFAGWDPYDGLNSKVFKALPLVGRSALARLVWIQLFKRNPVNLRRPALVPKERNSKAIGLFLHGYCNLHRIGGSLAEGARERIEELGEALLQMATPGYSGMAWGYNFPWQCRREFLFPKGEPTVVATQFCASALLEAYDITGREDFRDAALSSARFVLDDLHRTPVGDGELLSYSRMPGNDTIYNASLLGSRLLMLCRAYGAPDGDELLRVARSSVAAACSMQRPDGAWTYGVNAATQWVDSFHTGYNLDALHTYTELSSDDTFRPNLERGLAYYTSRFFLPDGTPRYYDTRTYPIDIHCPGQLFVTLSRLGRWREHRALAKSVMAWTLGRMQSPRGYFYYQLKRGISSRIPYMRWSDAFMFAAMSHYLLEEKNYADTLL